MRVRVSQGDGLDETATTPLTIDETDEDADARMGCDETMVVPGTCIPTTKMLIFHISSVESVLIVVKSDSPDPP